MTIKMFCATAALALTGSASAAVVSYSTYIASGVGDTSWVITTAGVASANFGGSDVTFGGVNWEGSQTNGHPASETYVAVAGYSLYHSVPGFSWASNNPTLFYPSTPTASLLHSGTTLNSVNTTIDINGLTLGQEYMAKFVFADSRTVPSGTTTTLTALGSDSGASTATTYSYSDGQFLVVTATWTASRAGVSFRPSINGGNFNQLNAAQIVAVPEPSAALLGLLAPLVLTRRRR